MDKAQNVLSEFHKHFTNMPLDFREKVCAECGWSVPTFYRKMRLRPVVHPDGSTAPIISNAEREGIIRVIKETVTRTHNKIPK